MLHAICVRLVTACIALSGIGSVPLQPGAASKGTGPDDVWRYQFMNLTPLSDGGYALVPGYMANDFTFRPWRNMIVTSRQIPFLDKDWLRNAPLIRGNMLGAPADPPLRILSVPANGPTQKHYLPGVFMEEHRLFIAFDVVRITTTAYDTLLRTNEAPPLVNEEGVDIISIPTPPQYADFVRKAAVLSLRDGVESQREIPIGPEITITAAPYVMRVAEE